MPPVSLGRHQLLFPVGHGGMSDVYLALVNSGEAVNKVLVIKQLRASMLDEPEALSMFMDEARLAARLHHPNVVQTFELGQEGPIPYMTMEFLDGQPLHRVLRRIGGPPASASLSNGQIDRVLGERPDTPRDPLTLGMRLRIITEMLEALHYAHELRDYDGSPMQVVHRDVSPQNLFITYDGQIKLVDFGIAKATDSITRTEGRGLKGKLAYMSPQQANGEAVDRRTDVFAAGVMLWELLSGRRLWAEHNEASLARRLVDHELPELNLEQVPRALVDICTRALAPRAEDRYPSADAFRRALERFMDAEGFDASPRAIGRRVAQAFAPERNDMRARIDQELLRMAGGEVSGLGSSSLWRDGYRGEHTDRTLDSAGSEDSRPDEVTADYGPKDGYEPPEPEPPAPLREISGEIGVPQAHSMPDPPPAPATVSARARWTIGLGIGLGLLSAASIAATVVRPRSSAPAQLDDSSLEPSSSSDSSGAERGALPPPLGASEGDCDAADKPRVTLSGEIEADATLHCDREYVLTFNTRVAPGVTLTIEPGTRLLGDRATKGALVVSPGARLIAAGTPERPIVFTSASPEGEREPGDWGGVVLLGRAPINLRDAAGQPMLGKVEGIAGVAAYGGDDPEDDSGVLRYVRIEYPGVEIAPSNELNGLTLAGVGRGTTLDHVQVRASSDDCFEFFGGTVDAKYLICDAPGDDAFDFDHGYQGRLQHLLVRDRPVGSHIDERASNGIEVDNDPNGTLAEPRTRPQLWNASLCGLGGGHAPSYALLARRAASPELGAVLISGFDYALDLRDPATRLALRGLALVAQPGAEADERDDDGGFDEAAWLADPARLLAPDPAGFGGCSEPATSMLPRAPIVAGGALAPPDDGFFDATTHVGAFAGPDDDWTQPWAAWVE